MELTLHPFIQNILNSASNELFQYLLLFVFSMMPVTECRLTIPFGILVFGLPWYIVLPVCVLSNAFIGAFLVLALDKLIIIFSKVKFLRTIIDRLIVSSKGKYKKYNRFKSSGLLLFVGIPFPGTGAWTGALMISTIILFFSGAAFAFFVVCPIIFKFFIAMAPETILVMTDINQYLSFVFKIVFAFGIAFEIPIATILLIKSEVASKESLVNARPYLFVIFLIVGMLLTPPDIFSQLFLAIPMYILFEVGIFFAGNK